MKKIFIVLLWSLLLIGCGSAFSDVAEIESLNLQNGDKQLIPKNSHDGDIILDAINKKDKSDKSTVS